MAVQQLVIDHTTDNDTLFLMPDGSPMARGLVPRDPRHQAVGYLGGLCPPMHAVSMPLIPESEWEPRIKEMETTKSRLSDIRRAGNFGKPIPSLDQNDPRRPGYWGYCWMHGPVHAGMLVRAMNNQPYVALSAFAGAAIIKGGANDGGWGALALEWIAANGVPSQKLWPQLATDLALDTPAMRANAALHKVSESWVDLQASVWNRDLTYAQVITCLLNRVPVVGDFNWWGHCVVLMDPVIVEPGSVGVRILNSWGDSWQDMGEAVLRGSQAVPDNAVAPRVVRASSELAA